MDAITISRVSALCQRPDHTSMSAIDEGGMFHGEANRIHGTKMRQGAYCSQDTSAPTKPNDH
jgi:hypothetical protein